MKLEEKISKVQELLDEILSSETILMPNQMLIDQYVSLLGSITENQPTKETANLGMKLMYKIYIAEIQEESKRWIYDIAEKTYAYFKF